MDFSLSHWEAGREEHSTAPGPSAPAWVCHLNHGRRDRTKGPLPGEGAHRAPKNVHSLQPSSWDKSIFQRFPAHLDLSVCQQHLRCHTSGSGPAQSATKARNSLCPQTMTTWSSSPPQRYGRDRGLAVQLPTDFTAHSNHKEFWDFIKMTDKMLTYPEIL